MPSYRNDTAARITWGGSWIEAGETKVCPTHWPYTELGLTLVSALPVVATPIRHSQRVSLAAPSAATPASAVLTVATGKTLTFAAGTIDHPMFAAANGALAVQGEDLAVQIECAADDTLVVSNPTGTNVILVQLASTTANKNTAALIQGEVRALGTVDGIDVSDIVVTGNTAYNNAPVAGRALGTPATVVLDFGDDKTLTISSVYCGSWYNALSVAVEQADDDDLAVGEADGLITIQLAADTASKNSASAIQTLLQALTIEGLDVSAATVTESSEYAAARPAGTKSVRSHEVYSDNEMTTALGKLTITAGHGGATGENVTNFSLGIAQDDVLDVSYAAGTGGLPGLVTILLANATPGNNSAANIQTALRAVTGTDLGEYLSLATVTADATWAASPPIAYNASQLVTADSVVGVDAASIAEAPLTGGDEEIVEETDLDNAVDGTTVSTVALPSYGKGTLSLIQISGEVTAQLGDSDEEVLLTTSVEYQGTHRYGKVPSVTLTAIAAAEVLVLVEEAE